MEAGFGCGIGRMLGVGGDAFDGSDIDDASAAGLAKVGQRGLGQEQRRLQVQGDHPVPLFGQDLGDAAFEHDAGVVDEDVDPADPVGPLFDNRGKGSCVGQVCRNAVHLRVALQSGIKGLSLYDGDFGSFFEEAVRDPPADSPATPGDQGPFAPKVHCGGQSVSGLVQKKQVFASQSSAAEPTAPSLPAVSA